MTTELDMQRRIGEALWQAGIEGEFTETGIVVMAEDGDEFQVTVTQIDTTFDGMVKRAQDARL